MTASVPLVILGSTIFIGALAMMFSRIQAFECRQDLPGVCR